MADEKDQIGCGAEGLSFYVWRASRECQREVKGQRDTDALAKLRATVKSKLSLNSIHNGLYVLILDLQSLISINFSGQLF